MQTPRFWRNSPARALTAEASWQAIPVFSIICDAMTAIWWGAVLVVEDSRSPAAGTTFDVSLVSCLVSRFQAFSRSETRPDPQAVLTSYSLNRRGWTRTVQGSVPIPIVKAIGRCRARPWSTMPVLGQLIKCPVYPSGYHGSMSACPRPLSSSRSSAGRPGNRGLLFETWRWGSF